MNDLTLLYLVGIIIISICCLTDIIFCFITIGQLYFRNILVSINEYHKKFTVITMISYTLCTIGDITEMIIRYIHYIKLNSWFRFEGYLIAAKDVAYYVGNLTFFLLLFTRIRISFQVSKYSMYFLCLLLVTSTIFSIIFCIITIYFAGKINSRYTSTRLHYTVLCSYPLSISDFALNISLFILFIYKIKNKDSMEGQEMLDDGSSSAASCMDDKKAIWNVMIKHCILFGIALFVNQSWYIVNIIDDSDHLDVYVTLIMIYVVRAIENAINIIILWLVFKINHHSYLCLCKCCHLCILKYCMKADPSIMQEGFIKRNIHHTPTSLLSDNDKIEGHDLIVTHRNVNAFKKVEGHNVLITQVN
eukprot:167128_1